MSWVNFGDELKKAINRAGIRKTVDATIIVEEGGRVIKEIFSPAVAESAEPLFFRNQTLTVRVSSPIIAQEVRLQSPTLIATMNKRLGKDTVLTISIRQS